MVVQVQVEIDTDTVGIEGMRGMKLVLEGVKKAGNQGQDQDLAPGNEIGQRELSRVRRRATLFMHFIPKF